MIRKIIGLCARDQGHAAMYGILEQSLLEFRENGLSWDDLLHQAEHQGVAPLLYKHTSTFKEILPENFQRLLRSLYLRSRRANHLRNHCVIEILDDFDREQINVLLVKGIALSNFVYSSPGFRLMRDIDLLVAKVDLPRARQLLFDRGYREDETHDIPDDYYHLPPLTKVVDGMVINIELHHNLLPFHPQYPLWPLGRSYRSARAIEMDKRQALTLNLEENLWYIYLHGFQSPLTYEEFRFVHVADMVSFVELFLDEIDWQRVRAEFPLLPHILSRFHFVTPWQDHVIRELNLDIGQVPDRPGAPYRGWPQRRIKDVAVNELPQLLKETCWPSPWWRQIYYGRGSLKVLFFQHPRTIWRWMKTYARARFRPSSSE